MSAQAKHDGTDAINRELQMNALRGNMILFSFLLLACLVIRAVQADDASPTGRNKSVVRLLSTEKLAGNGVWVRPILLQQ